MARDTLDWSRLGYVQVVREHGELCSAIMLLADLHRMKSPARRVLLFPRVWLKKTENDEYDAEMQTTRRLLRTAVRRYGVSLLPLEPIVDGADGELRSGPLHERQQLTDPPQTHCHLPTPLPACTPSLTTRESSIFRAQARCSMHRRWTRCLHFPRVRRWLPTQRRLTDTIYQHRCCSSTQRWRRFIN
jgi:hypothetical protein